MLRRIPAREEARIGIELVVVAKQAGSVRVAEDIVLVIELVLQDVVNHPAEERNVGARTQPTVDVGLGRRTRITRIDHDPGGTAVLCAFHPTRTQRVVFDIVGADRQNDVGVGEIAPVARHGTAAETRSEARNGRGVTHARLVVNRNDAERTGELLNEPTFLVVELGSTQTCDAVAAVDRHAVFGFHEARITGLFNMTSDFLSSLIPRNAFPLRRARTAHHRIDHAVGMSRHRTVGIDDIAKAPHGGALRAQTAEVDRMIRIAFEIDEFAVARRANRAAAAGAVAADVRDFLDAFKLVRLFQTVGFGSC